MTDEDIVLGVKIDVAEGAKSLKQLRGEYKEHLKDLEGLAVGSKEYIAQLSKIGKIKDDIGDLNTAIKAFNPEGKIQAFGSVIGGLAGGFQAAQGAAALFGKQGEEIQKTLLKVQAASAFAEGIKGVTSLGDSFKVLGNVIKSNPLILIATIIVGIGVALYALKDKIGIVGKAFTAIGDAIGWVTDKVKEFTDWIGLSDFAMEKLSESIVKNSEIAKKATNDRYDSEIAAAKRAGKATELLEIARLFALEKANDAIIKQLRLKKDISDEEKKQLEDLLEENRKYYIQVQDLNAQDDRNRLEKSKKEAEDWESHHAELIAIKKKFLQEIRDAQLRADQIEADFERDRAAEIAATRQADQAATFEAMDAETEKFLEQQKIKKEEFKKEAEDKKALREGELDGTQQLLSATQALTDLAFNQQLARAHGNAKAEAEIRKKQFNVNKAFGIANAVIDGVQAVQKALNNPYPLNIILAVASGVLAAANIAKIAATKFDAGGGGSSDTGIPAGTLNTGSSGVPVNSPSQSSTQVNADGSVGANNQRVYVVESDISSKQRGVARIEENAKV